MATRSYKGWPGWLLMAVVLAGLLAIGVHRAAQPATADERVERIAEQLACPVCQGESVAASRAPSAIQIHSNIDRLVVEGKLSDAEIIQQIDDNYEQDLRLVPSARGFDALIYALPVMAAVGGAAGLFVAFARWRRRPNAAGPTDDDRAMVAAAREELEQAADR